MKWVTTGSVLLCAIYGTYLGVQDRSILIGAVVGAIVGLLVAGFLWLLVLIARKFREKAPRAARYVGLGLFWLGVAIAVYGFGVAMFAAYEGAPPHLIVYIALGGMAYGVIGWLIRLLLVRPISN